MLLDELNRNGKLSVMTIQPMCIYTKTLDSYSICWDKFLDKELDIEDIDDSYGLEIEKRGDVLIVYIPRNAKGTIKKTNPNADCTIFYKNIECDLVFEDEPIDYYLEIMES